MTGCDEREKEWKNGELSFEYLDGRERKKKEGKEKYGKLKESDKRGREGKKMVGNVNGAVLGRRKEGEMYDKGKRRERRKGMM